MDRFNQNNVSTEAAYVTPEVAAALSRSFMTRVFSWMFLALAITAVTSLLWAANPALMGLMFAAGKLSMLGWVIMLAPLGFVLIMSFGYQKLSAPVLIILFLAYALIMGMSLSFIFLVYTQSSILITFAVASGMFGVMAVAGYVTRTDLSRFGSILFMALIGVIIAMLVNFFVGSSTLDYIISIAGVLIFTGLTAYDVQKLKRIGVQASTTGTVAVKASVMGALTLYLDFINLFLFLLRLFGGRK
jgi:uncharacterized protein